MRFVPMQAHQAGDQELVSQFLGLVLGGDVLDRMAEEQGVADGFVDHAVQDVRYDFALVKVSV